jgi:uncharacterized protein (TIGR02466 family)
METRMAITLTRVDNLFPIPLWRFAIDEDGLNDGLMAEIRKRRASEPGIPNSNRKGWQSERDLFQRTEPAQLRLLGVIKEVTLRAIQSLDPKLDRDALRIVMNGWININPPGGYNSPHQHTDAVLSGVYYVAVPKGKSDTGGAIEFLSPHPIRQLGGLIRNAMLSERLRVQPVAGDLLMFPGQLPHWVHPNDSGKERVTIAFNVTVGPRA